MADTLDKFTRTIKVFYEEITNKLQGGKQGIDKLLFPTPDADESASFSLDSLMVAPHGVVFRKRGEQSAVRPYEPGLGNIFEVPRASEKTPISEELRDSVIAGIESTGAVSAHQARLLQQIIEQHVSAHTATRWKLAIDVLRTGAFSPIGYNGLDIDVDISFGRAGGCSVTYDFTGAGATIDTALKELVDAGKAYGLPYDNLVCIMGMDWVSAFEAASATQDRMIANTANVILEQNLVAPELLNTQGLYVIARYRVPGTARTVTLCAFSPTDQFIQYKGAAAADFFPATEAILFSLSDRRYNVMRGVDALDDGGRIRRAVGEIVFDSFRGNDPVTEYIRSQARYAFIPANPNHMIRSVGTFAS